MRWPSLIVLAIFFAASSASAQSAAPIVPAAIFTDPPADPSHPAKMAVLHFPTHGVLINGLIYEPSGAELHPTLVIFHGWPGNEKNLDIAQAVRRAGWNAVTFNYRGSWGSPGNFRFAQTLEDADAVLAYLRDPQNAMRFGIDLKRIAIAGHSMGGWIAAMTASHDHGLLGTILISAADFGRLGQMPRDKLVAEAADESETLAGVTAESMADELQANTKAFGLDNAISGLLQMPLLVLTSDDGLAPDGQALVRGIQAKGGKRATMVHVATDHSWSDHRIAPESSIITWLAGLK